MSQEQFEVYDHLAVEEPPVDHLVDTHPTSPVRPEELDAPMPAARSGSHWVGVLSLLGAFGFTLATVAVLLLPNRPADSPLPSVLPTDAPVTQPPTQEVVSVANDPAVAPPISPELRAALLNAPLVVEENSGDSIAVERNIYAPFTIIPDRPRSEVIQYTVVEGDSINSIAERFGLQPETIAWSNDRRIIQVLRPGDLVNVPPADGVYRQAVGTRTITDYAAENGVADPYVILDSEYNTLYGLTPDSVPPSGTWLFIPGGTWEEITWWSPPVEREGGEGDPAGAYITFAAGEPGSCGRVANPGGGAAWTNPLGNGTWVRGFTSWHTGVDLSASVGTPVSAANGGRVIFAGWNSWGYGYMVVLAHGPFTTLYGHLDSINVGCGQDVAPGQVIAGSGNSGNSSGPHLHFEIRYLDVPQDPAYTFGW